jgi:AcrR family transcriptional regulator
MSTKDRILDAAERLFARDGVEATSLRAITTEAGANLAAVNYHFQSKDALVSAVIMRRIAPVNERRLALLEECEREAGNGPLPIEGVLNAFIRPVVEIFASHARDFAPMMGRLYTEKFEHIEKIYKTHMAPVAQRFIGAFQRAVPGMPRTEIVWRLHFSLGAMSHTLAASHMLRLMSDGECDPSDVEGTLMRLEAFIIGGLTAPVAEVEHHAVH